MFVHEHYNLKISSRQPFYFVFKKLKWVYTNIFLCYYPLKGGFNLERTYSIIKKITKINSRTIR